LAITRIQLCGRLVAEIEGRRVEEDLPGRQGRLLFAYLILHRLRDVTRDELVAALWPEGTDAGLAPLLSKLRRLVPVAGRGEVRIVLPPDAWVDFRCGGRSTSPGRSGARARGRLRLLRPGSSHAAHRDARLPARS
jgi:hypothetical protein